MKNKIDQNEFQKYTQKSRIKTKSSITKGLHHLFIHELKEMYWAEKALAKAIPKMSKQASSEELIEVLADHLDDTKEHVLRLEEVFLAINKTVDAKKCEAVEGLIKQTEETLENAQKGLICDMAILSAHQKIELYRIISYEMLYSFAKILGENSASPLLEETLEEEREAYERLALVTESFLNIAVLALDDEQGDEDIDEEDNLEEELYNPFAIPKSKS